MALDPWIEARLKGRKGPHLRFEHDSGFTIDDPDDTGCLDVSQGRVVGFWHDVVEGGDDFYENLPNCEDGCSERPAQVRTEVDLFVTSAEARDYVASLTAARPASALSPIAQAGDGAVLYDETSDGYREQIAWVRRGSVVGTVEVRGPQGRPLDADAAALAVAFSRQIESAPQTGRPFDAIQTIAAPLPSSEWPATGLVGAGWGAATSELTEFWSPDAGYYDFAYGFSRYGEDPDGQGSKEAARMARNDAVRHGRLVSVHLHLFPPEDSDLLDAGADTELTLYSTTSGARQALVDRVNLALMYPGGQRFQVPGLDGAVGVRTWTDAGSTPPTFEGYTWSVYFTHGPSVARALIATQDPGDAARASVTRAAQRWEVRLDRVLGPVG